MNRPLVHHASAAIAAQKGGVGKTTLTGALAGILGHTGWGVLVINTDSQSSMAGTLGFEATLTSTMASA